MGSATAGEASHRGRPSADDSPARETGGIEHTVHIDQDQRPAWLHPSTIYAAQGFIAWARRGPIDCLGVHFSDDADLDVPRSETACGAFE
jgi:hypothetical protein